MHTGEHSPAVLKDMCNANLQEFFLCRDAELEHAVVCTSECTCHRVSRGLHAVFSRVCISLGLHRDGGQARVSGCPGRPVCFHCHRGNAELKGWDSEQTDSCSAARRISNELTGLLVDLAQAAEIPAALTDCS